LLRVGLHGGKHPFARLIGIALTEIVKLRSGSRDRSEDRAGGLASLDGTPPCSVNEEPRAAPGPDG
jgi:hypothetical protein